MTSAERTRDDLDNRIIWLETQLADAARKQEIAAARVVALKKRITELGRLIMKPLDDA